MDCPNCGADVGGSHGHHQGCLLGALLSVLENRDHNLDGLDLDKIDTGELWERWGGPAADWVAEQLEIPPYAL